MARIALNMALGKLNERVIGMTKRTIIDTLWRFDIDHNSVLTRRAIRNAVRGMLAFILEKDIIICDSCDVALILVVGIRHLADEPAEVLVSVSTIPASIRTCAVKVAYNAVSQAMELEVSADPLSLPSLGLGSLSFESKEDRSKAYMWIAKRTL